MSRTRRLFRWLLLSLLLLLAAPVALLAVLATEPGTGWALQEAGDLVRDEKTGVYRPRS